MSRIDWNVPENPWYAAVTDACVINHLGWNEDDARQTLAALVRWEVQTALNPAVSPEAQALVDKGMAAGLPTYGQSGFQLVMWHHNTWVETLKRIRAECAHDFQPEDPTDEDCGAVCVICGEEGHGWYCKSSPTKTCEYNEDEWCIYCGNPKERK